MSTTTRDPKEIDLDDIPRTSRPDPQPWLTAEDAKGWRRVRRVRRGPGQKPLTTLVVHFNREQSDWIEAESQRTGIDPFDLVRTLVDDARTRADT